MLNPGGGKSVVFDQKSDMPTKVGGQTALFTPTIAYPPSVSGGNKLNTAGERTTTAPGRWLKYYETADQSVGYISGNYISWSPLWWDSTVRYRYSDGAGGTILEASEWAGYCQIIDPIRYALFWDTTLISNLTALPINNGSDIAIKNNNSYTVDSIRMRAAYIHMASRTDTTIRDTLIIGVTPINTDFYYDSTSYNSLDSNSTWVFNNPTITHGRKLYASQPLSADSINRAVLVDNTISGAIQTLDTFILNPRDTTIAHTASITGDSNTLQTYVFPVRKGAGNIIPAGQHIAISVSFKSGDHWAANIDTIKAFNRFCPVFGFQFGSSTGSTVHTTWMPYLYAQYPDYNGASYLDARGRPSGNTTTYPRINHSGHPARWLSQFVAQDFNGKSQSGDGYFDQYMWLDAHVTCTGCGTVSHTAAVNNLNSVVNTIAAYPNPANNNLTVKFILTQIADVNVTISNAVGQVVDASHVSNVSNGKVEFNTSVLQSGIYFVTVSSNGEQHTGKITISH